MNGADVLLALALAAALTLAVAHCVRRLRRGEGCCGGCAACRECRARRDMTAILHERAKDTKGVQKFCQKE